jgi:L-malate glycosyltransferase
MRDSSPTHRVLLTAESSGYGGIEHRLLDDIRVLVNMGIEPTLAPARFDGVNRLRANAEEAGATHLDWQPYKFLERQHTQFPLPQLAALRRRAIQGKPYRLAHVAMTWTTAGLTRAHEIAAARIPAVLSLHCTYPKQSLKSACQPYVRRALGNVVGAYAVSEGARRSFMSVYGDLVRFPIDVIPNGVDTQRFAPDALTRHQLRAELGIDPAACLITWIGRLEALKNPLLALEALAVALRSDQQLHLLVLGDGPQRADLAARAAQADLAGRVTLAGHVSDVAKYLKCSDVFMSTSLAEGFPLAPAEAHACGVRLVLPKIEAFETPFGAIAATRLCDAYTPAVFAEALLAQAAIQHPPVDPVDRLRFDANAMRKALGSFYAATLERLEAAA